MKFVERPFYNIKGFDFGAVAWVIMFFVAPMVFWVIPAQAKICWHIYFHWIFILELMFQQMHLVKYKIKHFLC